jgi:two-component system sensor histidine kinase CpxA
MRRLSLEPKILLLAAVNVALLCGVVFAFMHWQDGLESLLMAPGQARLRDLGEQASHLMRDLDNEGRTELLAKYESIHGVRLGLYENEGAYHAGSLRELPDPVLREMRPRRPPPDRAEPDLPVPTKELPRFKKKDGKGKKKGQPPPPAVFLVSLDSAYWFGVRVPIFDPEQERNVPGTLIVRAESFYSTPLLFDAKPWALLALGVFGITLACWIPFIRGLAKSIEQINAAAGRIADGGFDAKVSTRREDEIGKLAEAINRMATQLRGFVHGQKRFVGDIAHELSAPIARAQVAVAILEERVDPSQLRFAQSVREEVDQMSALAGELLHFSKVGLNTRQADPVAVEVDDIVRRALEREAGAHPAIRFQESPGLRAMAQPEGLFRAVSNLVRNAIRYAGEDGPIAISSRRERDKVLITVADNGPGLPPDALEHVFTPFYRPDTARTPGVGGAGLGLAIVKACVESSGGAVSCANRRPKGLEVTIELTASW